MVEDPDELAIRAPNRLLADLLTEAGRRLLGQAVEFPFGDDEAYLVLDSLRVEPDAGLARLDPIGDSITMMRRLGDEALAFNPFTPLTDGVAAVGRITTDAVQSSTTRAMTMRAKYLLRGRVPVTGRVEVEASEVRWSGHRIDRLWARADHVHMKVAGPSLHPLPLAAALYANGLARSPRLELLIEGITARLSVGQETLDGWVESMHSPFQLRLQEENRVYVEHPRFGSLGGVEVEPVAHNGSVRLRVHDLNVAGRHLRPPARLTERLTVPLPQLAKGVRVTSVHATGQELTLGLTLDEICEPITVDQMLDIRRRLTARLTGPFALPRLR